MFSKKPKIGKPKKSLFKTIRQNRTAKKKSKQNKKRPEQRLQKKHKVSYTIPADTKFSYVMPVLFSIAVICILTSLGWMRYNTVQYNHSVMASSMNYGESLPLWGGTADGTLKLGHTELSHDKKTLAVEVQYDDDAHKSLSSYGNRYKLRLVHTKDNPMHVDMQYGMFGTDGSGVLTIHSDKGFANKAFVVMLIDNGHLVTSDDLTDNVGTTMSDQDLDESITSQLSNTNGTDTEEQKQDEGIGSKLGISDDKNKKKLPPIYYVRLNPQGMKVADDNWDNDRDVVNDLFVYGNLAQINKKLRALEKKRDEGRVSLREMQKRLKQNPADSIAEDNKNDIQTSLENINESIETAQANRDKIRHGAIQNDVLAPKQKNFETFNVDSIDSMR